MDGLSEALHGLFRVFRGPAVIAPLLFATPSIERRGDDVVIAGALVGAINRNVERIVATGAPVDVVYTGVLRHAALGRIVAEDRRRIRFDTLERTYRIEHRGTLRTVATFAEAAAELARYELVFRGAGAPGKIDAEVEAHLSYRSELGLPGGTDALWDGRAPFLSIRDLDRLLTGGSP